MADNASWEADLEAALADSTDTEEPQATEDTASLESQDPPIEDTPDPADDTHADDPLASADTAEESTEDAPESAEPVTAQAVTDPPKPNWDSDENPHYQKARQFDDTQAKARVLVHQLAEKRAAELQEQRIRALSDDDPQRVVEIQQLVTDAQKPVLQQAQQLEGEVEFAAKLATVTEAAVANILTPEQHQQVLAEVERLMALPGGPDYLQREIATRKAERSQYETERTADRQKIAELERRLAAQSVLDERRKSGADMVDSNTGVNGSFQQRYDAASGEAALDVILEEFIPR